MDVSGFLTYFAVLAALLALSSEEKKLEIAIKLKFKRWVVSCIIFLFLSLYFLFYDVLAVSGLLLPYSWIPGFDSNSSLLLLCIFVSIVFYFFIFNGAVSSGKVSQLLDALAEVNQSDKKLEHIEYVLNKNINVIKLQTTKKRLLEIVIDKLTTDKIRKKQNPFNEFSGEIVTLDVKEAAVFRFIIEPLTPYLINQPNTIMETIRTKLMTSKMKSYLFINNPSLALDLLFLIREPLTVADIEKLTDENSKFRFESDTYFVDHYSYNSIADFSILLSKAIGNVEYLGSSNFFESLEQYNNIHLNKEKCKLLERHDDLQDDTFIKNSFFNFYLNCIKCSSLEIIRNKQSYSPKFPTWHLTELLQNLVIISNEEVDKDCEFGSRAGYYIWESLNYQTIVYEEALRLEETDKYNATFESLGHSFYYILKNSKSRKIRVIAFEMLASVYFKNHAQGELLEAALHGIYGNGVKSALIDAKYLNDLLPYKGDNIYCCMLSRNLTDKLLS